MAWCVLHGMSMTYTAAISLALAYAALWLELMMGIIDAIYYKVYEKISTTDAAYEATADGGDADKDGTMS